VLITDDGEELPLPRPYDSDSDRDDDDDGGVSPPNESCLHSDEQQQQPAAWQLTPDPEMYKESPWSTPAASPRPRLAQLLAEDDLSTKTATPPASPFLKRMLKLPSLGGRSKGLDLRLTGSTEDVRSGILFRTSSRESTGSRASSRERSLTEGAPLGRTASSASARSNASTKKGFLPFRRTQSDDKVDQLVGNAQRVGRAPARAATTSSAHGTRLLNGRVYGARRGHQLKNSNLFETARDTEPEFVEWGYGGMGSNKTATQ
jgi:hypothetical protein